jgi:hypothetical protein
MVNSSEVLLSAVMFNKPKGGEKGTSYSRPNHRMQLTGPAFWFFVSRRRWSRPGNGS